MKRLLAVMVLLLCVAAESRAGINYVTYFEPDPQGNFSGPTVTTCTAISANRQRCRACSEVYDATTGQPTGKVCAYVARAASCGCKTSPCSEYGGCTYVY